MSRMFLTNQDKGGRRILVQGAIGDYSVPMLSTSKVVNINTSKKNSTNSNQPYDDRVVVDNYSSLQNFDEKRIYEGLTSYNKDDKTIYVWTGKTDAEGKYVWEKLDFTTEMGEADYTDLDYPF